METVFYAKIIDSADPIDNELRYTALVVSPKTEFDEGNGTLIRMSEDSFQQACDIFGEENLMNGLTAHLTFIYPDAQDVHRLVDRADSLAFHGNIHLDWFNDDLADELADEWTIVEDDEEVSHYALAYNGN